MMGRFFPIQARPRGKAAGLPRSAKGTGPADMRHVTLLTILVGVQTLVLVVIAFRALGLMKRAETTLDNVDQALKPIAASSQGLLQDLHALRETAQRAERRVTAAIDRVASTTDHMKHTVVARFWPVFGTVAAGRAVLKTLSARRRRSRGDREDEIADARFVAEGGPINDVR
jgi:hypothetical protein